MDRVILALLEHGRVEAAATALGVSSVTVYRVMKTPTFEAEFREARRNAFSRWITRLQHAAPAAVAVLFQIMADRGAPPAIRVRAAEIVLDHAASTFVLEDLDVRLDRLERADEKPPSESNMLEDAGDGTES
jgi:hypothetical protein